jgi:hypothetical protein
MALADSCRGCHRDNQPKFLPCRSSSESRAGAAWGELASCTPRRSPTPSIAATFPIAIAGVIVVFSFAQLRLSGSATLLGTVAIVLLDMGLHCLLGVVSSVNYMARRDVSMMCRGFVASSLVMLGGFLVMRRRMLQVLCNLLVVPCSLLRHEIFSG